MPLSEFYRMGNGKIESTQQKSTDISFLPDNEFVELVWENGQIMMQGQSSKAKKGPVSSNFQFHTPKLRDKDIGNGTTSKTGKFGLFESTFNDIAIPVPSVEMNLNHDDDMVPWLNYPVDDYCSELIPELSGVTVNEPSTRNCSNQTFRETHNVGVRNNGVNSQQGNALKLSSSSRTAELYPWSVHQGQASMPSLGSGVSDLISTNTGHTHHPVGGDPGQVQALAGGFSCTKMQKQNSGVPSSSNSSFLNFSHFLRPAATARANNLHTIVDVGPSDSPDVGNKDKNFGAATSTPSKSTFIDPNGGLQKEMGFCNQSNSVSAKADSNSLVTKPLEESHPAEQCEAVDTVKNDKGTYKGVQENEKTVEPIVASSSVCSGNSVERASNDATNNLKRKSRDTEDSEWQSEDVDEELVGVKRTNARGGTGSKRSRAAEVHNLSERRRRDRINEKMRALQELIPNCNKVDKASMLDEAIEYLKTLQLQVQIMSMGAGLYMPPMMFPTGMQPMHPAHMPHFSAMGLGMGMGMGFGMGMMDMNGGSRGCPMIPVQGAHYPPPPGPANFHGMPAGPNHQVYGHLGQVLPMTVSGSPMVPLPARPPINSNPKDLIPNTNSQTIHNADPSRSMNQTANQFQATNGDFDHSTMLQKNDSAPDGGGVAVKSSKADESVPSRAASSD